MASTSKTAVSYEDAISLMMFGFGDNPKPDPESVKLVESIVLKQLRDILFEASKQADHRNSKTIKPQDLVFLLRRDKHKMRRFVKYLNYKYTEIPSVHKKSNETPPKKIYTELINFIKKIDETGELMNIDEFDNIKHERAIRAERISSALDEERYREYAKARQMSFSSKQFSQGNRFRDWVDPQQELNLTQTSIQILEVFAYNIVGNIVDMALIIRENMKHKRGDPLSCLVGNYYNPSMFSAPHLPKQQTFPHKQEQVTLGQPPITVREIREAMRRCYNPQVGVLKFSNKSTGTPKPLFLM